ncbi:hypothetical protein SERLADRAFT_477922 [Serpula lacrymans var. lacrymans S7.9]|uniref:Uncharacterized protein n=1 Tax=Serpula lacrymans var. lacrymans (strain S7.9) TaxID=578457 RepID=F8P9Q7_SERL9|nr:uncharacterized protein SERLADRAFT_477922 [Serpula lacrymans var. lacrymans S7.9]EGO20386.1 hypothetical protein SERLADRAFT_477922 [Serpula lacrymans var. lacrymans S7.9]
MVDRYRVHNKQPRERYHGPIVKPGAHGIRKVCVRLNAKHTLARERQVTKGDMDSSAACL